VLQSVAVSCSVLQCEAERQHKKDQAWPRQKTRTIVVAVFYSVLQYVAVQCSVLHCETERQHKRNQAWPRPKTQTIGYGDQRLPSPQQTNCLAPLLLPLLHVEYFETQIKKNHKTRVHSLDVQIKNLGPQMTNCLALLLLPLLHDIHIYIYTYGVATISRLLKILVLFCKRAL